jgi:DNA-binding response OmpR family regulator
VIADDPAMLALYKRLFLSEGYKVTLATIAYEHVKEVALLDPDLILLDLKLNGHYQGLLLIEKLRLYPPTHALLVIMCSAAQDMQEHEATFREKGILIVYKPFHTNELLQVIHQLLPSCERYDREAHPRKK